MPKDKQGEVTTDELAQMITRSFDGMMKYMQENFATKKELEKMEQNINARFDKVEERLGNVEEGVNVLNGKIGRLEEKFDTIIGTVQQRMNEQEREIRRVNLKLGIA